MEESDQFHAPDVEPQGKEPLVAIWCEAGWAPVQIWTRKAGGNSVLRHQVVVCGKNAEFLNPTASGTGSYRWALNG
jgi:hypothetical protein